MLRSRTGEPSSCFRFNLAELHPSFSCGNISSDHLRLSSTVSCLPSLRWRARLTRPVIVAAAAAIPERISVAHRSQVSVGDPLKSTALPPFGNQPPSRARVESKSRRGRGSHSRRAPPRRVDTERVIWLLGSLAWGELQRRHPAARRTGRIAALEVAERRSCTSKPGRITISGRAKLYLQRALMGLVAVARPYLPSRSRYRSLCRAPWSSRS